MKAINFIFLLLVVCVKVYAGDIDYTKITNKVILIGTKDDRQSLINSQNPKANLFSTDISYLRYSLELYTNGSEKQFVIKLGVESPIIQYYGYMIPSNAQLLLKLSDDSVIELTPVFHSQTTKSFFLWYAYFPVSEDLLKRTEIGVKKIRLELLNYDVKNEQLTNGYRDKDYKKDKIGKQLKKWYDEINKEFENNKDDFLMQLKTPQQLDIKEDF